jgi:hypothetical protein
VSLLDRRLSFGEAQSHRVAIERDRLWLNQYVSQKKDHGSVLKQRKRFSSKPAAILVSHLMTRVDANRGMKGEQIDALQGVRKG